MLKKVMASEIKEGMRFSEDLFFDDGVNMLAPKGMVLKKREIQALHSWKFKFVLTSGVALASDETLVEAELEELENVENGESEDVIQSLDEYINSQEKPQIDEIAFSSEQLLKLPAVLQNDAVYEKYRLIINYVDSVFKEISKGNFQVTKTIDKIVSSIMYLIQTEKSQVVGFILGGEVQEQLLAKSSVNTAILSIIIAQHFNFPKHRLITLATAAVLHDVGMLKIPDSIISKEGKLDDGEMHTMRSHANYGYKIIVNDLMYPEEVGRVALQHHEHWDGLGYPFRIEGGKVDILARIVAVADAFEAMVSPKSWRDSLVGYQAMKNLLSDNSRRFDPGIIRALIQSMGIYPIGSIVLLNNSSIARVVESHKDTPLRPIVSILIDEFGETYPQNSGELVDLKRNKNVFIARAIEPLEYRPVS